MVGNLTVGGVGKTPLVIALATHFRERGLKVAIISRGYGAKLKKFPYEILVDDNALKVGDEPLLLLLKTQCPVVIAPRRVDGVRYLIDKYRPDLIISDDGLQHYALGRAIEIVVVDGMRGFGNGMVLPAGPLREGVKRLCQADFIVINGEPVHASIAAVQKSIGLKTAKNFYKMNLLPDKLWPLIGTASMDLDVHKHSIAAIAAIGNPQRFFNLLSSMGLNFKAYTFADHHRFRAKDFRFKEKLIIMTEKDAVKCRSFASDTMYYLPIEAIIEDKFWERLRSHQKLGALCR